MAAQHAAHEIPRIPLEFLQRPPAPHDELRLAHDAVATPSTDAQRFYDQGLTYLHHFVWIEAARAFNQSLRLDPQLALAHVGLSFAYAELGEASAARRALQQAGAAAGVVNVHEQQHIMARELQVGAEDAPQDETKLAAYRRMLDVALQRFPADTELLLLRGIAEAANPADRGQNSPASAVPFYERVLTIVPDHFAAHHYLTHAYEHQGLLDAAVRHGEAYARLAPGVPHARHMLGHNLRRVGRMPDALKEFEAADRLEVAYAAREQMPIEYIWHYAHNLELLAAGYQATGQMRQAERCWQALFAVPTANLPQAVNARQWPAFLRSRGRLAEADAAANTLLTHPHPIVQAVGHIERGFVLLARGALKQSAAEANAAVGLVERAPAAAGLVALPLQALQGEVLLRTGQRAQGRVLLESVAREARSVTGPDEWSQAVGLLEAVARAARDVKDWELAERVAAHMIAQDRWSAAAHYATAFNAAHRGDRQTADAEFGLAERYWSAADADLLELRTIQEWRRGIFRR